MKENLFQLEQIKITVLDFRDNLVSTNSRWTLLWRCGSITIASQNEIQTSWCHHIREHFLETSEIYFAHHVISSAIEDEWEWST